MNFETNKNQKGLRGYTAKIIIIIKVVNNDYN